MIKTIQYIISVCIFSLLFITLLAGLAPNLSSKIVALGESVWPNYAQDLRKDLPEPECPLQDLQQKVGQCPETVTTPKMPPVDVDDGKDPFGEEIEEDPFGDNTEKDPFAEDTEEEDPFGDNTEKDPFGEEEETEDLFGDNTAPNTTQKSNINLALCPALRSALNNCELENAHYTEVQSKLTTSVRTYRTIEVYLSALSKFPYMKHLLVILTLLGAMAASIKREHIALRTPFNQMEHRVREISQIIVHILWIFSCYQDYLIQKNSSAQAEHLGLPLIWAFGFCMLVIVHLMNVRKKVDHIIEATPIRIMMVIPLYTYMSLIAGMYFLVVEGHLSGQAIYLHKFTQHPNIYLGIGLYIWAGMLFATTRIAKLFFKLLTPLKLPVHILAWLVVILSALPTAYSGASGIFVIATGAVLFEQLRLAGASKRLALAATAMSGSLGVVLRPCLVVVLIAVLNKQVTTDELFTNGLYVFLLTAFLLLLVMLWKNDEKIEIAPLSESLPQMKEGIKPLLVYIIVALVAYGIYGFVFETWLNEHTAPLILPGIMLLIVIWERKRILPNLPEEADQTPLWPNVVKATKESSLHVGALLMVMAASVGLGGVAERAEIMRAFPEDLGGPVGTMSVLVFMMILIGMTMDALGAVVLVSVTLAKVAYDSGIDPIHFWMMVLVAFELGYLTPPVAINHLLAKQVIGKEAELDSEGLTFWEDNEHLWLPMLVMGIALILVAFVPFLMY
jgi:TRAP-type C4-dicarboxylate transport system permease large subunit